MASSSLLDLVASIEGSEWGPSRDVLPKFKDIPYAPFSKSDKLGRIVDWSQSDSLNNDNRQNSRRYPQGSRRDNREAYGAGSGGAFAYYHDEDEASFLLVDGSKSSAARRGGASGPGMGRGGAQFTRGSRGVGPGGRGGMGRGMFRGSGPPRGAARRGGRFGWRGDYHDKQARSRDASVVVGPDWQILEEIDFARLNKLRLEVDTVDPETISTYGFLHEYDRTYDRVNTKADKPLQTNIERMRYNPTSSEDPIIQSLSSKAMGQIFATDSILSLLMTATRSVYPWDLVVTKEGDKLFFDKREGGALDYLSVNENAADPPQETEKDSINSPAALSLEATYLNSAFSWQIVKEDSKTDMDNPNPFYSEDEPAPLASCVYRYRKFDLSITENEDVGIVVRTEVDSVMKGSASAPNNTSGSENDDVFITIRALNEFDPRAQGSGGAPDWRTKLDSQRGAVVATEMKNNSFKLARWAVQSILAGAEQMKIGYVSRVNPRDPLRHVILGTQWHKPRDFASQMNVNLANGWGIVRTLADLCLKQPEGKYVLLKDPNKGVLRLYAVPYNAFDPIGEDSIDESVSEDSQAGDF